MASSIDITISQLPLPSRDELRALAIEEGLDLEGADDLSVRPDRISISFWDRRWGVDNSLAFANAVSEKYPYLRVSHVEEWDNRDADESGGEGFELVAGQVVREGNIEWVWREVQRA